MEYDMQYGICLNLTELLRVGELKKLPKISAAGFTYVETNAASCADLENDETGAIKQALEQSGLKCSRACVLFPGTIKVVGPNADNKLIKEYLGALMPKLAALGVETVVFGSGGARRIPDGFPYEQAFEQFCACARAVAEAGKVHGIKVALEHLNPRETNLLTTVGETMKAVRRTNHPGCGLLFDYYHVDHSKGELTEVFDGRDILIHSHVAVPGSRLYPAPGDEDAIRPYFEVLRKCGYNGSVSVEATLHEGKSFEENLASAFELLSGLAGE